MELKALMIEVSSGKSVRVWIEGGTMVKSDPTNHTVRVGDYVLFYAEIHYNPNVQANKSLCRTLGFGCGLQGRAVSQG